MRMCGVLCIPVGNSVSCVVAARRPKLCLGGVRARAQIEHVVVGCELRVAAHWGRLGHPGAGCAPLHPGVQQVWAKAQSVLLHRPQLKRLQIS